MTPIGTGALFDSGAAKRFRGIIRDRYRLLALRLEKKKIPLTFRLEDLASHILAQMGGYHDGVIICRYCRQPIDLSDAALDHAVPFARGGSPDLSNIEVVCKECNDRKGGLFPAEYEALLAFLEAEIPLARTEILKRLQQSTKLAASMRHNMGRISALKKSGEWQKVSKGRKMPFPERLP